MVEVKLISSSYEPVDQAYKAGCGEILKVKSRKSKRSNVKNDGDSPTGIAFKTQFYPSKEQVSILLKYCAFNRRVFNYALGEFKKDRELNISFKDTVKRISNSTASLRREIAEWSDGIPPYIYNKSVLNAINAYKNFFSRVKGGSLTAGFPRFKAKGKTPDVCYFYPLSNSFYTDERGYHFVRIPGLKSENGKSLALIRMAEAPKYNFDMTGCTITTKAGKWFISIQYKCQLDDLKRKRIKNNKVGIDLGITTALTLSNGCKYEAPRSHKSIKIGFKKQLPSKLMRRKHLRARAMIRKREHAYRDYFNLDKNFKIDSNFRKTHKLPIENLSKNYYKAKGDLQKIEYRIANIRKDWIEKVTTEIASNNKIIAMEDLNVSGMMSNSRLALSISDIGFFDIKNRLQQKSILYNNTFYSCHQFYPSSKLCSNCGTYNKDIDNLNIRSWTCPECNSTLDRDINASNNILKDYFNFLNFKIPEITT